MTYSIIQKSQLEGAKRIDAEYFEQKYLKVEKILNSIPTETINDISERVVNFGAYSLCNFIAWRDKGIPYLNVQNIKEGFIDFTDVKFIDEKVNEILNKSKVRERDLILTMAGTIGNVAVAHKLKSPVNSNQATAKITLKKGFSPYFLSVFLNCYYGKSQIIREIVSSVQPNIFLWQIKNFKIPIIPEEIQKKIENIYLDSLNELENSRSLYSQAEDLLLEEFGLNNFKFKDDLFFIVDSSKAKDRIDADYFQPKYEQLINLLKTKNAKPLLEVVENVEPKFDPLKEPDKHFKYVELADINQSIGIIDGCSGVLGKEAPSRAKRLLKANDVIASSVEGSLEKVALVKKEQENFLASTGFFQFRSEKILPEVLLILSKSIILQMQLKRNSAGTILTAVSKDSLKEMIIPILPLSTQQKIAELVKKSHEARRKSKELLEEAKKKVEETIEKGSENQWKR